MQASPPKCLWLGVSDLVHDDISIQPIQDEVHDPSEDVDVPQQQESLSNGREKRQIRPP